MPELSFRAIVRQQILLLQHVSESLMTKALAGGRDQLENLFVTQEHLEHWLQYLSPLATELRTSPYDAPAPVLQRPSPPLPHEHVAYDAALEQWQRQQQAYAALDGQQEEALRPRVQFPPEPPWVEDLEREQGEGQG